MPLFLEQYAARQHDVATAFVQLDDAHIKLFANELVEVAHGSQVNLRTRQERLESDVDGQTTLDAGDNHALDDFVAVVTLADFVPNLDPVRLFLRKDDLTFAVFFFLKKNVYFFTNLQFAAAVREFIQINCAFGLVAHIYQDGVPSDMHHAPADNFAFLDMLETFFIEPFQFLVAADILHFHVIGRVTHLCCRRGFLHLLFHCLWHFLLYGLNLSRFVSHGNSSLLINYVQR